MIVLLFNKDEERVYGEGYVDKVNFGLYLFIFVLCS